MNIGIIDIRRIKIRQTNVERDQSFVFFEDINKLKKTNTNEKNMFDNRCFLKLQLRREGIESRRKRGEGGRGGEGSLTHKRTYFFNQSNCFFCSAFE